MKALRWSLGILAALVLLIVLAALIATQLINPNDYRGEADRLVSRDTGRPFVIEGHLRLGWYPWLTLGIGAARLGNPPGMRGPDLLEWRSARVPVRLLPLLLHRRIELGTIRVSGADIHLWRNAQGVGNWQHLLVSSRASGSASSPAPPIGGLILEDATLEFAAASGTIRLRRWQLHVGPCIRASRFRCARASSCRHRSCRLPACQSASTPRTCVRRARRSISPRRAGH